MIIRRLHRLSEIEPVRALAVAHARYEKSTKIVPLDWAARMRALVEAGQIDLFVVERDGPPVGYASMNRIVGTWLAEPYAHLDCLFVDESSRGAGVGRKLVDAVVDHARGLGLRELQWQTPAWNEGAIRFYRRMDVQQLGKERFFLSLA